MNKRHVSDAQLAEVLDALQQGTPGAEQRVTALTRALMLHQVELESQNRELRNAQHSLEESRERYEDLYDFAPIAYFTLDSRGCIEDANVTGAAMLGRARPLLIGAPFVSLVRFTEPRLFWDHLRRGFKAQGATVSELSFACGQAGLMHVQVTSTPELGPLGEVVGLRSAMFDITGRKQAELERDRALLAEHWRYQQLERVDHAMSVITRALANGSSAGTLHVVLQTIVDQACAVLDTECAAFVGPARGAEQSERWYLSGHGAERSMAFGRLPIVQRVLSKPLMRGRSRISALRGEPEFADLPAELAEPRSFLAVSLGPDAQPLGTLYVATKCDGTDFDTEDQRSIEMLAERLGAVVEVARLQDAMRAASEAR